MNAQSPYPMLASLLSVALLALCGCAPVCRLPVTHAETVTLSEIPPPIAKAFYAKFPGATIVWAGRFGSGTNAAYSFQFIQDGKSLATGIDTYGGVGDAYVPVIPNPSR
jgi:hypothetical protein